MPNPVHWNLKYDLQKRKTNVRQPIFLFDAMQTVEFQLQKCLDIEPNGKLATDVWKTSSIARLGLRSDSDKPSWRNNPEKSGGLYNPQTMAIESRQQQQQPQ